MPSFTQSEAPLHCFLSLAIAYNSTAILLSLCLSGMAAAMPASGADIRTVKVGQTMEYVSRAESHYYTCPKDVSLFATCKAIQFTCVKGKMTGDQVNESCISECSCLKNPLYQSKELACGNRYEPDTEGAKSLKQLCQTSHKYQRVGYGKGGPKMHSDSTNTKCESGCFCN